LLQVGPPMILGHVCAAAHVLEPTCDRTIGGPYFAILAQSVERIHGKDEVNSSILLDGSEKTLTHMCRCFLLVYCLCMENGPKLPHEQQRWEDATIEVVHEMVAENRLKEARLAAAMRVEVLEGVCRDTDDAIEKNEGEIDAQEWEVEKAHLQQEIAEFKKIIETIDTDTENDR
jgi:hypothetical protein